MWTGLASFPGELLVLAQSAVDPLTFASLGWQAWLTAATLLCVFIALMREAASPDLIMVSGLVVLLLAGVIRASDGLAGFSHPALIAIAALFIVAAAVRRTGALAFLGRIMTPRSPRLSSALARVMLPSSILSSFLNNTPIVAFLTPLVQDWGRKSGIPASKLLIPLSYATILGGMGTLIGTSTNLVVSDLLAQRTGQPFAMFELLWIGVPAALIGYIYFALVGGHLLPLRENDGGALGRSRRSYQFDLRVPPTSSVVGFTIEQAGLRHLEDAFLIHIQRQALYIGAVSPTQRLEADDILSFTGDPRILEGLLQRGTLTRVVELPEADGESEELPLYEAVVSPQSTLVGKTLKAADFRGTFDAVVLGIHRQGKRLEGSVGQSPIEPGDLLLIEARPGFEERWVPSNEFYLVAPLERGPVKDARKALHVLLVIIALVAVVTAGWLPMAIASVAAAMLVILIGSVSPGEARRSIDLSVVFVIASALGFERAIDVTELDAWLGGIVIEWTRGMGTLGTLAVVYLVATVLTEFLTNSVAAALAFPVGMVVAERLGVDPRPFAIAVAIAASASFITPIGYQTNLMVMGPGGYRFRDYVRVGLPLSLIIMGVALTMIWLVWLR